MKVIKKTAEYTVFQKRNSRYAVKDASKKIVNGEEKAKILLAEGLIKLTAPKPKEEEPAEEPAAAEAAEDSGESEE